MEKISQHTWPEIVFGSSESRISQAIRRAVLEGKLRKLAPRLYTSDLNSPPDHIVKRHLYHILGEYYPGAILSYRTALEGGPSSDGVIVLTYKYTKQLTLPGLKIRLVKGAGAEPGDTPFMGKLFLASRERALLENLQPSRKRKENAKVLPRTYIEEYLDNLCRTYGTEELNNIRNKARLLQKKLNMAKEFKILDSMIGALQGTRETEVLKTSVFLARAARMPYDNQRLELFAKLALVLQENKLPLPKIPSITENGLNNLAFIDPKMPMIF